MKLKTFVGLGLMAGPAAVGAAHAQSTEPQTVKTSYFSLSGGPIGDADYSYKVEDVFPVEAHVGGGTIIAAAYGQQFGPDWRGEVSLSWQDRDNANTSWMFGANLTGPGMSAYTLDAIGYRDFAINSRAKLYLGAGIGIGSVTVDDGVIKDSTGQGLHLQAVAGIEARLNDNIGVYVEGRIRSMRPSIQAGTAGASGRVDDDFDITSSSLQAGFKIFL